MPVAHLRTSSSIGVAEVCLKSARQDVGPHAGLDGNVENVFLSIMLGELIPNSGRSKPLPDQLHKTSRNCYRDRLQCPKLKSFQFRKTCPLRMPLLVGPPPVGGKDIPFERDFG